MSAPLCLIAAGGTGGHMFPAQALAEVLLARGWRVIVQGGAEERIEALDAHLWTFRDDGFLPHGTWREQDAESQPVLLTVNEDNPNAAQVRFLIDGAAMPAEAESYERIVLMFDGDETVITAMIGHLLDNAVTFTRPGDQVRLSVRRADDTIAFAVADNGPGVSAADIERILRPFEQAGDVTQHAEGSGLGLTLVKAFAELHGGTLAIASAPGEGFTATVMLPAAG